MILHRLHHRFSLDLTLRGNTSIHQKKFHVYDVGILVCCFRSSSCSLVDKAKSWSDKCAIASSFTLSLSLSELLSSSSSCTLLCICTPCLSSWWILRKVR